MKNNNHSSPWSIIKRIYAPIVKDYVTVYAGEATLFVVISTIPLISLILSIVGLILPNISLDSFMDEYLSTGLTEIATFFIDDLESAPSVPLLSISALFTLWCASRGINSLLNGIGTIYTSKKGDNYFVNRLMSILFTFLFIIFIVIFVVVMLFGDILVSKLNLGNAALLKELKTPFFVVVLILIFTGFYFFVAQRSEHVRHGFFRHVPGAVFSALGWLVFSYFYSKYIAFFPAASYIYGSLAAVTLSVLWLYFCLILLLFGAEINKLFFAGDETVSFKSTDKPENEQF